MVSNIVTPYMLSAYISDMIGQHLEAKNHRCRDVRTCVISVHTDMPYWTAIVIYCKDRHANALSLTPLDQSLTLLVDWGTFDINSQSHIHILNTMASGFPVFSTKFLQPSREDICIERESHYPFYKSSTVTPQILKGKTTVNPVVSAS